MTHSDHDPEWYQHGKWKRCRICQRRYQREWQRQRKIRLWAAAKAHYGRTCAICGADRQLTIDHVDGSGGEHRTVIGNRILAWLARNDYPAGFRILCFPCNIEEDVKRRARRPAPAG